ncbi:MAG TPA: adenylyltransferase/cytidyltransferase family protein [Xanthomonadales bacterium]|nr:adenylyltransferase/cytidyltransferase family protein [Xanthomonadales bacterium]
MIEIRKNPTESQHLLPSLALLECFTLPPSSWQANRNASHSPETESQKIYDVSLVIGRFQPLHWGHIYLIHQALEISNSVIIGIGSSSTTDNDNPFSALQRHLLLDKSLGREGIRSRVNNIVHLTDHDDDNLWLQKTIERTGEIGAVVGNNPWVNGIFANAGYEAVEIPMYKRNIYKGGEIRRQLRHAGFFNPCCTWCPP